MVPDLNADLHCHSTVSDGTLEPEALAARAKANGVELWALTDHDEVGGQRRAREAALAAGLPYLSGVEISVTFLGKTVHIVGLGIDSDDAALARASPTTRGGREPPRARDGRRARQGRHPGALRRGAALRRQPRPHLAHPLRAPPRRERRLRRHAGGVPALPHRGKPGLRAAPLGDARRRGALDRRRGRDRGRRAPGALQVRADRGVRALQRVQGPRRTRRRGASRAATPRPRGQRYAATAREFGLLASRGSDFHSPDESRIDLGGLPPLPDGPDAGVEELHSRLPRRTTARPNRRGADNRRMAQYFEVHPDNPQPRLLKQAAQILEDGGVAAMPTDSSYALACHLDDKAAAEQLRRIRGVDDRHHLTLLCRDLSELASYARVDNRQYRLLKLGTPGPFTFILEATKEVPRRVSHPSRRTIGLRVPDHPVTQALLALLGQPLLGDDADRARRERADERPARDPRPLPEERAGDRRRRRLPDAADDGDRSHRRRSRGGCGRAAATRRLARAGLERSPLSAARSERAVLRRSAAVTTISTFHCGLASAASTVARGGAWPGAPRVPHLVHPAKSARSARKIWALSSCALVAAGTRQQRVDRRQHLARLAARCPCVASAATWPAR